jgi:hypothetical protein
MLSEFIIKQIGEVISFLARPYAILKTTLVAHTQDTTNTPLGRENSTRITFLATGGEWLPH